MPDNPSETTTPVLLPQIDVTQMTGDASAIAAKTEFVKVYAESQRIIIDAKAAHDAQANAASLEEAKTLMEGIAGMISGTLSSEPVQKLFDAKAKQMTAEQTEAGERRKAEIDAQARRDQNEAAAKRRRDYLGAATIVALVVIVGAMSLVAVYLVSKRDIDAKSMAVVASNIASAIIGLAFGRKASN